MAVGSRSTTRSCWAARGAGGKPGPRAGAHPARPDGWSRRSPSTGAPRWSGRAGRPATPPPTTRLHAQVCGDAHLSNVGAYASRRERQAGVRHQERLRRDPARPVRVGRQAAGRELRDRWRDRGFTSAERRAIVLAMAENYRVRMKQAAGMRNLDIWYAHIEVEALFELLQAAASNSRPRPGRASPKPEPRTACRPSPSSPMRSRRTRIIAPAHPRDRPPAPD